jgi:hypothetical protein
MPTRGGGSMQAETEPAARNRRPEPDLSVHYRRGRAPAQGPRTTGRTVGLRAPARQLIVERIRTLLRDTGNIMWKILSSVVLVLALSGPSALAANPRNEAKALVQFGIEVAQKGLWKEAMYRWERAVEVDPTYAAAFNNLAVAYEHEGLFEKARKAYDTAMSLDPKSASIRQNYEFFKEINDRASRRNTK